MSTDPADLLTASVLCNDARPEAQGWVGDPTETALLEHARQHGLAVSDLPTQHPRRHEWPFDADRKRMTTLHAHATGWRAYTKGAPETVLPRCVAQAGPDGPVPLDQAAVMALAQEMAERGLRVLALTQRDGNAPVESQSADQIEHELVLLGMIGMIDPPRPEARQAVAECLSAGIRPVMITGDHPATALAIARELGIAAPQADARGHREVITGTELALLDDDALITEVARVSVFARMDPAQKIRIVQALQARGEAPTWPAKPPAWSCWTTTSPPSWEPCVKADASSTTSANSSATP
jgi:Ca2+-transporting ATPase